MIFVNYFILTFLVVYLSIFLSKYVDELDKKTNLSGAFIGGVLLAAVTSLPEFMTSISSIFIVKEPMLIQGNVLGSNIFNLVILGLVVLIFPKRFKFSRISKSHIWSSICAILMSTIVYFGFNWNYIINLKIFNINLASILIIILYFVNLKTINSDENNNEESSTNLTVKQIYIRFAIYSLLLVIVSIFLTRVTSELNERFNLGSTVGGAIFLGIATSLPELTSSFNLAKLGNFNASFGNILGSNIFNFTILSISDILYRNDSIFIANSEALSLIFYGIISLIFTLILIFSQKKRILSTVLSLLIIYCYINSIITSI